MNIDWTGVFPALTTKFTADDKLDLPLFEKNLNAQLAAGVNGIVLGGTLGEASVLSTDEKETLVKFAVEKCAGKVPVVLNIGNTIGGTIPPRKPPASPRNSLVRIGASK